MTSIEFIKVWKRYRENDTWKCNLEGVIDVYESAIFNAQFSDYGDFELVLPYMDSTMTLFCLTPDLISNYEGFIGYTYMLEVVGFDNTLWIVKQIQVTTNEDGAIRIIITGTGILGLLDNMILADTSLLSEGYITNASVQGNVVYNLDYSIDKGRLYACSKGVIGYTEDDTNWVTMALPLKWNLNMYTICYGDDKVFVGGQLGAYFIYSADLTTLISSGSFSGLREIIDSCFALGKFWCVDVYGYVYSSSDGISWSQQRVSAGSSRNKRIAYSDSDKRLMHISNYTIFLSIDGDTWYESDTTSFQVYNLKYINSLFFAIGANGYVRKWDISGTSDKTIQITSENVKLTNIAYYGGQYVIIGHPDVYAPDEELVYISSDGETWELADRFYLNNPLTSLERGVNSFVAFYRDCYISSDAKTWSKTGYTGFNKPYDRKGEVLYMITWLLDCGQTSKVYDKYEPDTQIEGYSNLGFKFLADDNNWSSGSTILSPDSYTFSLGNGLAETVIEYLQNYDCGIYACMVLYDGYYIPLLTIRDRKQNTGIVFTTATGMLSEQELTFDFSKTRDTVYIVGQNAINKDGEQDNGIWVVGVDNKISLPNDTTSRNGIYKSDYQRTLTNDDLDKNKLINTLVEKNKLNKDYTSEPVVKLNGVINLTKLRDDENVGLGDVANIMVYGLTMPIMITGITYAQDTSGLKIDCEYKEIS